MSATQTVVAEPQQIPMTELPSQRGSKDTEAAPSQTQPPADTDAVEREPASPIFKLVVAGFSFFFSGVNDGTLGPLIPYMLTMFGISTGEIAILYATTFAGWLLAAITNPILSAHFTLGQLLMLGSVLQLLAQCLRPWSPFPLFCITFFIQALGMAYQDSFSNTFVSGLKSVPHRWLGFILMEDACYALGCLVGPLIATAIANSPDSGPINAWRRSYFVLIGIGFVNLVGVAVAFKDTLWSRLSNVTQNTDRNKNKVAMQEMAGLMKNRALWTISLFYFFYLGACMTAGGWVVEFLTSVRGGQLSAMGYVPTGFFGGLFLGRTVLAEPTFRFGEKRMVLVYCACCAALQLVFWLQPNIIASAVALSLMGFFFGPLFATGMSVASKVLPQASQSAALGFVFVLAQAGGAIFPSITGLLATSAGVAVLQPIVLALIVAAGALWWMIPKIPHRNE